MSSSYNFPINTFDGKRSFRRFTLKSDWGSNYSETDPQRTMAYLYLQKSARDARIIRQSIYPGPNQSGVIVEYLIQLNPTPGHQTELTILIDETKRNLVDRWCSEKLRQVLQAHCLQLQEIDTGEISFISPKITAHLIERWWTPTNPANGYIIENVDFLEEIFIPILKDANFKNNEWGLTLVPRISTDPIVMPNIYVYPLKELMEQADTLDISIEKV